MSLRRAGIQFVTLVLIFLHAASAPAFEPQGGIAATTRTRPKQVEEARRRFSAGLALYDAGSFLQAQEEFKKAYSLAPSYKLLYNLALVERQLGNTAEAIHTFETYLAYGAWELEDARVAEVTKIIGELMPRVVSAKVHSALPGVQVNIDGAFVGQTPLEDVVFLNPGKRKITGTLEGYITDQRVLDGKAGDVVDIDLTLRRPTWQIPWPRFLVVVAVLGIVVLLVRRALRAPAPASTPARTRAAEPGGTDEPRA